MENKNTRGNSQAAKKEGGVARQGGLITTFFKKEDAPKKATMTKEQAEAIPVISQKEPVKQASPVKQESKDQGKRSSVNGSPAKKVKTTTITNTTAEQSTGPQSESTVGHLSAVKEDIVDHKISEFKHELLDEVQSDPVEQAKKRSLRPRKGMNYKQMLDGDEYTIKTIEDEQMEIKQMYDGGEEDDEDDEDEYIERASDDEEYAQKTLLGNKRRRKTLKDDEDDVVMDEDMVEESEEEEEALMDELENEEVSFEVTPASKRKRKEQQKKLAKKGRNQAQDADIEEDAEDGKEETVFIDNLPSDENEIKKMLKDVKKHIKNLERQFFEEEDSENEELLKESIPDEKHDEKLLALQELSHIKQFWCIPLSVNVKDYDFDKLAKEQMKMGGRLFDVITIDPPWQLSSANPTRGVAIAYDTLNDREILGMPFDKIQTDGFLFIWVINAKYRFALQMMEKFGYKLVDEIAWVKQTVNGKIAKGHGYYLQHAKETCLVGVKGNVRNKARFNIESDVIFSQRRGQSQKPEEIYEIAEALVPNGYYLEIFGRRNNLHNGWVTIGNEI